MPRTTIYRSSRVTLILALVAAAPAAVRAQQSPAPATHTVRPGDTLWDLAQRYLGDPFLWPKIFRLNTDVVEDPHWIYPGEVLRLSGEGVPAVPSEDTPAPAVEAAQPQAPAGEYEYPMPEFARRRANRPNESLRSYVNAEYQPLRAGEFYSARFLSENRELPFGRMLGPVTPPQIRYIREGQPAYLYDLVGVLAPDGATYAKGDTLLVAQREPGFEDLGEVIIPTGLVVITGQDENQYLGEVIRVYGPIRHGQAVMIAARFQPGPKVRAVAAKDTVTGRVLGTRDYVDLKIPQNQLLIDIGGSQGVAAGDLVEIWRESGSRPNAAFSTPEVMARGQVVRVGERSATVLLTGVISPDIATGSAVRRVATLP
ncbi:MAG: LysM peptidoglycan-binding domain-containing protein [Gemmatimonadota bacterium]|jgi:LysM repeat protein|nr:LysM peptidoglycan-binding domain-containing protein [Gemmatimonadota bacterium]